MVPFWALILISVHGDALATLPGFHSQESCNKVGLYLQTKFHHVSQGLQDRGPTLTYDCVQVE